MSIDIPVTNERPDKEYPEGTFQTEKGSFYVPEIAADGRTVYRRHKFDGIEYEPQPLTTFISGMTKEESDLLLHIAFKDGNYFAPEYNEYLKPFSAVIKQERAGVSNEADVVADVSELREGALAFLIVARQTPDGASEPCFAKEIAFTPTPGAKVVEFHSYKGSLAPCHIGHDVA